MASLPPRFPLWGGARRPRRDRERVNGPRSTGERLATVLERLARKRPAVPAAAGTPPAPGAALAAAPPPDLPVDPVDPRHLVELWRNWAMVMGPELASLALPLGRRNDVLVVGGEDNLALQELSFQTPELLERANAFMDAPLSSPVFTRVELRLLMGLRPLTLPPDMQAAERPRLPPPRPERLGDHLADMRPDSPVARCYAAYLRMHDLL